MYRDLMGKRKKIENIFAEDLENCSILMVCKNKDLDYDAPLHYRDEFTLEVEGWDNTRIEGYCADLGEVTYTDDLVVIVNGENLGYCEPVEIATF